jgi:hypothetical protein
MAMTSTEGVVGMPSDSLAAALVQAEASTVRLRQVEQLRVAAQSLVEEASRLGCDQLVPASQAAAPLVTAAMLMSDGAIRMMGTEFVSAGRVALVDAATVTGGSTRACGLELRDRGASWIAAIIYDRVRPDLDDLDADPTFDAVTELQ